MLGETYASGAALSAASAFEVVVVDRNAVSRDRLSDCLIRSGLGVTRLADGSACLDYLRGQRPDCILLDVSPPEGANLDTLAELRHQFSAVPVFVIAEGADIRTAVEAMKRGAHDFLERPLAFAALLPHLQALVTADDHSAVSPIKTSGVEVSEVFPGSHQLTSREREVLSQIASAASNKEAGRRLGISPRTVEVHRARIMKKLSARNTADLVRIALSGRET